ncbi:MAG: phenylalanine--tRNA ligase beta subunit-related protein [Minisyncoccia bacterium]
MIISYNWLNNFFNNKLPTPESIAETLTNNIAEVDAINTAPNGQTILDVKITPNLAHSCLSHRGLARMLGAKINILPNKNSRDLIDYKISETKNKLTVEIEDNKDCRRYIGRIIEGVKVEPSPEWLKESLETIGQRSINNIVDATNFVLNEIGQPTHVFDADKLLKRENTIDIEIKRSKSGQNLTTLDNKSVDLDESVLMISNSDRPLAIAGIKGGTQAELTNDTVNIVLESASFSPALIRKTAQKLKILTDASKRYENDFAPEVAEEAMEILTKIILEIAGTTETKCGEVIDNFPRRANPYKVGVSVGDVVKILGFTISQEEIADIFTRLNFDYKIVKPLDEVIKLSETLIGKPYRYGASVTYDAPKEFDCSGFTSYLFAQAGIAIPRIAIDQFVYGEEIPEKDLQPGDLVFANSEEGQIRTETADFLPGTKVSVGVDHVGLYLGKGEIIHATRHSSGVIKEKLADSEQFKNVAGFRRMSDNSERFVVTIPVERVDLRMKQDLVEDIAMIYGYDKIPDIESLKGNFISKVNKQYYYANKVRKTLIELGFAEIYTYAFATVGEIELQNPMNSEIPFLRANLASRVSESLEFNVRQAELIGMPQVKVFEIGKIFPKSGEVMSLAIGVKSAQGVKVAEKDDVVLNKAIQQVTSILGITKMDGTSDTKTNVKEINFDEVITKLPEPTSYDFALPGVASDLRFRKISQYPFMIRDIAVFVPVETEENKLLNLITEKAGQLLVRTRLFDVFTKKFPDGSAKTSYAYRLIFQSYEKTLSDEEINKIMSEMTIALNNQPNWQVR